MSTIQVRVDEKIKKSASAVLAKMGMDMSGAVKIYLHQIVATQGIPFPILTENGMTIQQEKEILKAAEEAKMGINVSKTFDNVDDLFKDLNS